MSGRYVLGDAPSLDNAASSFGRLQVAVTEQIRQLDALGDWRTLGAWQGKAADEAWAELQTFRRQLSESTGQLAEAVTTLQNEAVTIQTKSSEIRTKIGIGVGAAGLVFTTVGTAVIILFSEGLEVTSATARHNQATVQGWFPTFVAGVQDGWSLAFRASKWRFFGALGFQLIIPGASLVAGHVRAQTWPTWTDLAEFLVGSGVGLLVGELQTAFLLQSPLQLTGNALVGGGATGLITGLQTLIGQEIRGEDGINWTAVGIETGVGAGIGSLGAAGASAIINKYRISDSSTLTQIVVDPSGPALSQRLSTLGPVTMEAITDAADGVTTTVAHFGSRQVINADQLGQLSYATVNTLSKQFSRLSLAAGLTEELGTTGLPSATSTLVSVRQRAESIAEASALSAGAQSNALRATTAASAVGGEINDLVTTQRAIVARVTEYAADGVSIADFNAYESRAKVTLNHLQDLVEQKFSDYQAKVAASRGGLQAIADSGNGVDRTGALAVINNENVLDRSVRDAVARSRSDVRVSANVLDQQTTVVTEAMTGEQKRLALKRIAGQSVFGIALGISYGIPNGAALLPALQPKPTNSTP
ncbi:MAG: hypothetical protein ACR2KJ_09025 [Jatrophihabitans sp.]